MKRMLVAVIILTLILPAVYGLPSPPHPAWPPSSPLTALYGFNDGGNSTPALSLPWYGIQQWEVDVCTQGLTSSLGSISGANDVTDMSLSTPIYMDTVTLLAKKSQYSDGYTSGYYYEVGWYLQPFQGQMQANLYLFDRLGNNITLASGSPTDQAAWDGYQAFPIPCDPKIFTGKCVSLSENITRARLEWWMTNGTNSGPHQSLSTTFILVNETNQ